MSRWGQGRGGRPWRRLRDRVMQRDRHLCQPCLSAGRYTQAEEVDHIVPVANEGTDDMENLQAICVECHQAKTATEGNGANNHPDWLPKPACRVELVTGPPGAGKSTYCKAQAKQGDVIIDLDECFVEVCGVHGHKADREHLNAAIRLRNSKIAALSRKPKGKAYVIVSAPTQAEVDWWTAKLGAEHKRIDPGLSVCLTQIDHSRRELVLGWYEKAGSGAWTAKRMTRAQRRELPGSHWGR